MNAPARRLHLAALGGRHRPTATLVLNVAEFYGQYSEAVQRAATAALAPVEKHLQARSPLHPYPPILRFLGSVCAGVSLGEPNCKQLAHACLPLPAGR